jgi:hypothetical protein
VKLSHALNLEGEGVINTRIYTSSRRQSVILYAPCESMESVLIFVRAGAEFVASKLQARVSHLSRVISFVRLGLTFIGDQGVSVNYPFVPYKFGILTYTMNTPLYRTA